MMTSPQKMLQDKELHVVSEEEMPGFIPVPGLPAAGLRAMGVTGSGEQLWKFRCPDCGKWAYIDDDQLCGRVSIDHTGEGCTFRQNLDLSGLTGEQAPSPRAVEDAAREVVEVQLPIDGGQPAATAS
jgi:predicted RNA-binding Zn-ribbon protein involved in translation (DUF1610 family)